MVFCVEYVDKEGAEIKVEVSEFVHISFFVHGSAVTLRGIGERQLLLVDWNLPRPGRQENRSNLPEILASGVIWESVNWDNELVPPKKQTNSGDSNDSDNELVQSKKHAKLGDSDPRSPWNILDRMHSGIFPTGSHPVALPLPTILPTNHEPTKRCGGAHRGPQRLPEQNSPPDSLPSRQLKIFHAINQPPPNFLTVQNPS
ncbi:hypothetical protein B0H13DRAFT_1864474 [Mycena leptocephala]|nr:hypothetical protein B0H13DRAFT_1864474 [Mycena leptocephala]